MKRWNGWGDEATGYPLPESAAGYLTEQLGEGKCIEDAPLEMEAAQPGEIETIPPLPNLWAELRWAARTEGVVHLDDLLLRRVRLGLLLPRGGLDIIESVRTTVQGELGWSDQRWMEETERYRKIWKDYYSPL
jgi:glycerol-3-phosphate dehydrogenase